MTWELLGQHDFRFLAFSATCLSFGLSVSRMLRLCFITNLKWWHPLHLILSAIFGLAFWGILIKLWMTYSLSAALTVFAVSSVANLMLLSLIYLVRWILERSSE